MGIDLDILNKLSDDDIKIICKNADLEMMLGPMKHCSSRYPKYVRLIGRLDKVSELAKKNLPDIAYRLYKKDDTNYVKFFAMEAIKYKMNFKEMLKEFMGDGAEPEQVSTYTIEDFKKIFHGILNMSGRSMNLELFFLQTRMFDVEISDDMKRQIENEWQRLMEEKAFKKEIHVKYAQEFKQKEDEIKAKMEIQKVEYGKKIMTLESEIKGLKADVASSKQSVEMLLIDVEKGRSELIEKQRLVDEKSKEIEELKVQIEIMQFDIDDMTAKLQERRHEVYSKIEAEWQEENQEKISKIKELDRNAAKLREEIIELEEKKKQFERTAQEWNEHIESYFSNIDQKIIERRIESILYKNEYYNYVSSQVAATSEYKGVVNDLYVQKGYKVEVKEKCLDYEDYIETLEVNLLNIGDKMPAGMMNDCFNSAINSGLCPLICGYRAREMAMALIASRYAEKPEIISVPAGYGNINELCKAIDMAETTTVIVEDVFGRMNEGIILPVLRDSGGKVVIFTSESIEDLVHLQMYYYNYLQLMVCDKHTAIQSNEFLYADANELLTGSVYTGKELGYKLSRQLFEYIGMNNSYVVTRGSVMCNLLAGEKNTEETALLKLLSTEVKWIIKENEKEKLVELFKSNESKYSRQIIECMG